MTIQVDPPRNLTKIAVDQAWHRLIAKMNSEFIDTGWSNILFVDGTDGLDATAKRGSLTFKYQTVAAALADALVNDTVWVGPGVYPEALVWPNINNVTLQGVGDSAIITNAAASPTITIAPTVDTVTSLTIKDISIYNTGANPCVSIAGANDLELGNEGTVRLTNLGMLSLPLDTSPGTLAVNVCGEMELLTINSGNNDWTFAQTARVLVHNCLVNDITTENDAAGTLPAAGLANMVLDSVDCDDVEVNGVAVLAATDDTQMVNLRGALTDTATANGSIMMSGRITGDVEVTFDFDDQASLTALILDQARISGSFTFGLAAGGVGGNLVRCRALEAIFYDGSAGTIEAGNEAVVDLRGAVFEQSALASAGATPGTIDRTNWFQSVPLASLPIAAITWGIPFATVPDQVSVEIGNVADGPVAITLKTSTGCTVTSTAGNADVIVRAFLQEL